MSGKNHLETGWHEMKSKAGHMPSTVGLAIDRVTNQIHYLLRTTASERHQASVSAEAYEAEMMKFLSQLNLPRMQGDLRLSNPQMAVTEFLLERYGKGKLALTESSGRIGQTGLPYLVNRYESKLGREQPMTLKSLLDESTHSKNAFLSIRWNTKSYGAHSFNIFGEVGAPLSRMQHFITLPAKADNPNEVQSLIGLAPSAYGMSQHINVLDGGDRFVIDKAPKRGNEASQTSEYVLLGNFRGNHTKLNHWIYGFKQ